MNKIERKNIINIIRLSTSKDGRSKADKMILQLGCFAQNAVPEGHVIEQKKHTKNILRGRSRGVKEN